jgi:hypothetical protein
MKKISVTMFSVPEKIQIEDLEQIIQKYQRLNQLAR